MHGGDAWDRSLPMHGTRGQGAAFTAAVQNVYDS